MVGAELTDRFSLMQFSLDELSCPVSLPVNRGNPGLPDCRNHLMHFLNGLSLPKGIKPPDPGLADTQPCTATASILYQGLSGSAFSAASNVSEKLPTTAINEVLTRFQIWVSKKRSRVMRVDLSVPELRWQQSFVVLHVAGLDKPFWLLQDTVRGYTLGDWMTGAACSHPRVNQTAFTPVCQLYQNAVSLDDITKFFNAIQSGGNLCALACGENAVHGSLSQGSSIASRRLLLSEAMPKVSSIPRKLYSAYFAIIVITTGPVSSTD